MITPAPAHNELERLAALHAYDILDTLPEASFDRITRLTARTLEVPYALINFVDAGYMWGKSCYGVTENRSSRALSPCAHAILQPDLTIVQDVQQDERFAGNPTFEGICFYAAAPLITPDGYAVGTLCVMHPDTYTWTAQKAETLYDLAALVMDELELRRREREAEQKWESLERVNAHKSEFFASMNHELRTPVSAILGLSELLLEGEGGSLSETQSSYLRTIEESGEHLLNLVNGVLDLAKLEAGQMKLEWQTVSLERLGQQSVALVEAQARRKGVRLTLEGTPGSVRGDPTQLKQILLNLLSNAVKFTPKGGTVTLEIHTSPETVTFEVRDSGVGIRPEHLGRLFEKYVQVDDSLERRHRGTGLGLALIKHLTELHGGRVEVQSVFGEGSVFKVLLPARTG